MTAIRKFTPKHGQLNWNSTKMHTIQEEAIDLFQPENDIERLLLKQPEFIKGLDWGIPRYGHPEGKVLYHVAEVLENINLLNSLSPLFRKRLRLITFVHDTFKYDDDKNRPRDWTRHHAVLARNFLSNFTDDRAILDVTELHDEAFYAWRSIYLANTVTKGEARFQQLQNRLGDNLQLFYLFFRCDTQTGDKIQTPLKWFEESVEGIDVINF